MKDSQIDALESYDGPGGVIGWDEEEITGKKLLGILKAGPSKVLVGDNTDHFYWGKVVKIDLGEAWSVVVEFDGPKNEAWKTVESFCPEDIWGAAY